jgi:hypothetical protein
MCEKKTGSDMICQGRQIDIRPSRKNVFKDTWLLFWEYHANPKPSAFKRAFPLFADEL